MNSLSKWKISVYLAVIFLAGAVTGVFVTFKVGRYLMPRPEKMAERWCAELQSKLSLTPEQFQKIVPIVNGTLIQLKTTLMEQVSNTISNSNARIASELTPEQQAKFEQMVKEHQALIRRQFKEETNSKTEKL